METSNPVPCIPDDIILDIFCRLPVKSLVRFSSVCKFWQTLIQSNQFLIKSHMEKSLENNKNFPLLIYNKRSSKRSCTCNDSFIEIEKLNNINIGTGYLCLEDNFEVAGCSNGILCLYKFCDCGSDARIYLWNPALRQCMALPDSEILCGFTDLGFFFDSFNDDYNVVKILWFDPDIEIYSLKTNSWKSYETNLPVRPYFTLLDNWIPVACNRHLHWLTVEYDTPAKVYQVIRFDFVRENFEVIAIPENIPLQRSSVQIGVFKDCLALVCWLPENRYEVWVMKDEEEEEKDGGMSKSWKFIDPKYLDGRIQYPHSIKEVAEGYSRRNFVVVDYVESLISVSASAKLIL